MKKLLVTFIEEHKTFFTYLLAIIGPMLSVALGYSLQYNNFPSPHPVFLFLPSIIISAWYGGVRAGILSTLLSAIGATFIAFLSNPTSHIVLLGETILFLFEGYLLSSAIEYYKHTDREAIHTAKEQEYKKHIEQLEKEKATLADEVKSRDEFLSIASHELRTPLTSMLLQLQTALHNIRSVSLAQFSVENLLRMLESAEQQSKRLTRMITDLLNVSLITTGRLELEKENIDLTTVVKDVVGRFAEKAEKEKIAIHLRTTKALLMYADPLRIEQVVTNLISNAIKYGNAKPFFVTVKKEGNQGVIIVEDQGIGIPKELQGHIFERFVRAVPSQNYKGLGVGLYITQQIIMAHKGSISVKSNQGRGSVFTIKLPLKKVKR